MSIRQEILKTPEALQTTLEKGRPEFEALIRQMRWNDRPIFMIGSGPSYIVALSGARAFETLLGIPVVVRPSLDFASYSTSAIERRSVLLAVSQSGESAATLEAARAGRRRGAALLAMTANPESALAKLAGGVFLVRAGEEPDPRPRTVLCQQAAFLAVAILAARVLRKPDPQVEALEREIWALPGQIEWVLTQLQDGARSLASRVRESAGLTVAGAGFYHPTALLSAHLFGKLSGIRTQGFEPEEAGSIQDIPTKAGVAVTTPPTLLAVSGSTCRMKESMRLLASARRRAGAQVLAVTDSADRELAGEAALAVLLPGVSEMAGSALALALLQWTAYEISRSRVGNRRSEKGGAAGPDSQAE